MIREPDDYQGVIRLACTALGVRTDGDYLLALELLDPETPERPPTAGLAREVVAQLARYAADARFRFDLPLAPRGTAFQQQVWQALAAIPPGETRTYGALAQALGTAPRAVGGACRANPLPVVVPCHRVVGAQGLGGFAGQAAGRWPAIKQCLLRHEGAGAAGDGARAVGA